MDRWEGTAAFVALAGFVGVALAVAGVVPPGGGTTYYLETEHVENGSGPEDATVVPFEESPDPVVDAVTASLTGNASTAELRQKHRDLVPSYVEYEGEVYRVDTWHVDHTVHLSWFAVLGGGLLAFVAGATGFVLTRTRTASGD